ncbi:MAG: hypothetical protein PS018_21245 [bacterium]|nr:hypothetical protein [bacterium]
MLNGRKRAVIGLGALATFIFLELIAVTASVGVFLAVVLDVDLPFIGDEGQSQSARN